MTGSFADAHSDRAHAKHCATRSQHWGETLNLNQEVCLMERREFLKLTLGFTAAAAAIAAATTAAQAAPMLPPTDIPPAVPPKPAETAMRPEDANVEQALRDEGELVDDTDMSAHRRRRRRFIVVRRRPRRLFRRRRRVIYY
jgi:hypothetical protein